MVWKVQPTTGSTMNETQEWLRSHETGTFEEAEYIVPGFGHGFDREPLRYVTLSAFTHLLMLLLILAMPENAGALDLDGFSADDRFVQLAMAPERQEIEPPQWLGVAEEPEATARHRGSEGEAGDPDERTENRKMAIKQDSTPMDLEVKKARDLDVASTAGIASIAQVSSIHGDAARSVGSDALHAIGSMNADELGASKGMFGLGVRCADGDDCFGGGGTTSGSIGLKNVATRGKSSGRDYERGEPDLGEHDGKVPGRVITPQPPELVGGLDREIIRRVVRSHRRVIRFCYEAQLQKDPRIQGEVLAKFTILPTGRVLSSVSARSTLKNAAVEACLHSSIKRWVFPEPNGGGTVVVRYPFRFTPG